MNSFIFHRLLEKMERSLELPRVRNSGLEDIELQEEASLGLECGNGQTDQASHFQTGMQDNLTISMGINYTFSVILL